MNKTKKMVMVLNLTELQLLNSLHLSQTEYKVFWFVRSYPFTDSQEVADYFDIMIPYASTLLRKLADKGYLSRREAPDKTGGHYFEYILSKELREINPLKSQHTRT